MATDADWFRLVVALIALLTVAGFAGLYWRGEWLKLKREKGEAKHG